MKRKTCGFLVLMCVFVLKNPICNYAQLMSGDNATPTNATPTNAGAGFTAAQDEGKEANDWEYSEYNGEITITAYKGIESDVVIPDEIDDKQVVELGNGIFSGKTVTSVEMPDSIKKIGYNTFSRCDELINVSLSNSLSVLPVGTFEDCNKLETINLPESLEEIYSSAFYGTSLETLSIPKDVEKIHIDDFGSMPKTINEYNVDLDNQHFTSVDGMILSKDKSAFYFYPTGRIKENDAIKLPEFITEIKDLDTLFNGSVYHNIFLGDNIKIIKYSDLSSRYNYIWANPTSEVYKILSINNISINPATEEEFDMITDSKFEVAYNTDGTLMIVDYRGTNDIMNIPERFGDLIVTELSDDMFYHETVETIVIPRTIRKITARGPGMGYEWCIDWCRNIHKIVNNSTVSFPLTGKYTSKSCGWYDQEFSGGTKLDEIPAGETVYKHFGIEYSLKPEEETRLIDNYGYNEEFMLPIPPKRTGYVFKSWYIRKNSVGEVSEKMYIERIPSGTNDNIRVYPEYTKITNQNNGGSSSGGNSSGGGSSSGVHGVSRVTNNYYNTITVNISNSNIYSGTWVKLEDNWKLVSDGNYVKNAWAFIDNKWYLFNDEGNMCIGWKMIGDLWFYFLPDGSMSTGWNNINEKWYYMMPYGNLLTNSITPDGYKVEKDGAWVQ